MRLLCLFGFHDYYAIARVSWCSMHVGCHRCHREWGMNNDLGALVPWAAVESLYLRRGYTRGVDLVKPEKNRDQFPS